MLEEERRAVEVDTHFRLPDLSGHAPAGGRLITRPPLRLRTTYYDTADLRLCRSGATLSLHRGDDEPWRVTLPGHPGTPVELCLPGDASTIPQRLRDLVTSHTRGVDPVPVITLTTLRQTQQLCDPDDQVVLEVVDDLVSVTDGRRVALRFRQVVLQRRSGELALLDEVEAALRDAGARPGAATPAHVRALGLAATQPPDWPVPPSQLASTASAGEVVVAAIQRGAAGIVRHDPLVRLRSPASADATALSQLFAACRRLHRDLDTFAPLLAPDFAASLRDELGWLVDSLSAARDTEALRVRLRRTAQADPRIPLDQAAVLRLDADLAARLEDAVHVVEKAMCEPRYHRLLDALLAAATAAPLTPPAGAAAAAVLPGLPTPAWQRFATGGGDVEAPRHLTVDSPDGAWQATCRHGAAAGAAVASVAIVLGGDAAALTTAVTAVLDLLTEQQEAAIAADTWLAIANADPDDHALAVTAGRLYERERAASRAAREAFASAWRAASRRKLTDWMR